ncbi:MAG: hypothetical protein A2W91_20495 [Bacteroidetes bacterium GWF2_38_335]|nr:MAG: hypothetical protein A2W91_20495 [Bacteroidetes bacterium GWF2_38_335]OFY79464.1 MAG: hypothetical protein A2281_13590 [Bacteroidetes bacterium RIFOXYA12_FULL_38_20]HBS86600.1 hypothetical protein [Bacteroidales bacterium]
MVILFISSAGQIFSQDDDKRDFFVGGMFLHAGFISNENTVSAVDGECHGIGGKGVFHIFHKFRAGIEGYASNYSYPDNEGFYRLGWGGFTGDFLLYDKRLTVVISGTFGGGRVKDIYFLSDGQEADNFSVNYYTFTTLIVNPSISLEYRLKSNLKLTFKTDFISSLDQSELNRKRFANGPRFYLGVLFCK